MSDITLTVEDTEQVDLTVEDTEQVDMTVEDPKWGFNDSILIRR